MSTPTIDQVIDSLLENADFEESVSVAKAQSFITASVRFFILTPQSQSDQGSSLSISPQTIENLLNRARNFVAVNRTPSSNVKFLSVSEGFR